MVATVTSHVRDRPLCQGISVKPSGRLPSLRKRPEGFFMTGILAKVNAREMMSFQSFNGSRLACQSVMEDWGSDGCLRWHFPPTWLPPQAPCHFSPTSCLVIFLLTTISFSHVCSPGRLSSSTFLRSCLLNSHFGVALACWWTRQLWSHR